jgi:hypothetical protein
MNTSEQATLGLARAQHGAISRRQALAQGMTPHAIDHRLKSGEWVRLFQGTYRVAGTGHSYEQRLLAGCLAAGAGAVASHRGAAALFGMPGVPRWVEVTVPHTRRVAIVGVIAHRARRLGPGDVGTLRGIPVTTAGRTIADLAGGYSAARLGPLLDYALARRLVTRADLAARAALSHNSVLGQLLAERPASPRPMGSDFEAGLFRALQAAGLPVPLPQYRVLLEDGSAVFLDFAYPEVKLAIEADSYLWHASLADWQHDRARSGELVALGWAILPITYDLVARFPRAVAVRVARSLDIRRAG